MSGAEQESVPPADEAAAGEAAAGEAAADAQSRRIAEAYRRQLAENAELRSAATLGNRARAMATAAVIGIFVFVGGWSWMATQLNVRELDAVLGLHSAEVAASLQVLEVQPRPLIDAVTLSGTLEPGRVVNLVAPFHGRIRSIDFAYGERVEAGQALLALETEDVEVELREAETALIQARQKLQDLENWSSSPTVAAARRSLEQAQVSLGQAQQNYRATKALFDKGIVSRQELDSAETTWRNAEVSAAGAREAVAAALKQGDAAALEVARLAHANAQFKFDSLKRKIAGAVVRAPVSGIVLRPVPPPGSDSRGSGSGGQSGSLAVGAPVTENQILLSIGDLETLAISSNVSEYSIGQMRPGLKVNVTSDALPGLVLQGEVTSVSSQASATGGGVPSFGTTVTVHDLDEAARAKVRVGMSASLEVVVYHNPAAIVLPYSAVLGDAGNARVLVVPDDGGEPQPVPVRLGERTAEGIEITAGLQPGQRIVANASRATAFAGS